jgi:uncharacterized protein (UPF0305 family)
VLKIKSSKLFLQLKRSIKPYQSKIKAKETLISGENNSIHNTMSEYNLENFNEIINSSYEGSDDEVDENELDDFKMCIDNYFDLYAPDDKEFREFIKIISIYLNFIAKKPLHPPGILFSNGATVYQNKDSYHCTGKSVFIKENHSLCKYCICK